MIMSVRANVTQKMMLQIANQQCGSNTRVHTSYLSRLMVSIHDINASYEVTSKETVRPFSNLVPKGIHEHGLT